MYEVLVVWVFGVTADERGSKEKLGGLFLARHAMDTTITAYCTLSNKWVLNKFFRSR